MIVEAGARDGYPRVPVTVEEASSSREIMTPPGGSWEENGHSGEWHFLWHP